MRNSELTSNVDDFLLVRDLGQAGHRTTNGKNGTQATCSERHKAMPVLFEFLLLHSIADEDRAGRKAGLARDLRREIAQHCSHAAPC